MHVHQNVKIRSHVTSSGKEEEAGMAAGVHESLLGSFLSIFNGARLKINKIFLKRLYRGFIKLGT